MASRPRGRAVSVPRSWRRCRTAPACRPRRWPRRPASAPAWCRPWRATGCWHPVPLTDRPVLAAARSRPQGRRADAATACRRRAGCAELVARGGGRGAARRRAGRRQDRGLFRGGGRGLARRPARARAAARDRALGAVARPVRAPLRHAAGGLALGTDRGAAAAHLAADRRGRDRRRGRRPLRPVPAADRPRPDRRRRGARRQLQAGGERPLPRPRHGAGPRPARGLRRGPGLGHAVAGDRRSRPASSAAGRRREPGWRHVALPARHGGAAMPEVRLVDLRRDRPPRGGFLSPPLREALFRNLEDGAQSLLFLNRRGYAPLTLCRACGHRLACPNCSAWLVSHRLRGRLQCHHCGYAMSAPEHCPSCGAVGLLTASGPGRRAAGRGAGRDPAQGPARGDDQRHRRRRQGRDRLGPGDGEPRRRHPDRHPDHRQGPPLPRPHAGRRGRRRSRPGRRRPARGRAHLPAALPGGRPGRARGAARAGC